MKLDDEKIDRAVLALLYLGLHEEARAWKSFDWGAMGRLHEKGFISDPAVERKASSSPNKACANRSACWKNCSVLETALRLTIKDERLFR